MVVRTYKNVKTRTKLSKNIYVDGAGALFKNQYGLVVIFSEEGREETIIMKIKDFQNTENSQGIFIIPVLANITNNEAEYLAMREALRVCGKKEHIYTDSQLVVGQLVKGWSVNAKNLVKLFNECKRLKEKKSITIEWIPREENIAGKLLEKLKGKPFSEIFPDFSEKASWKREVLKHDW